MSGAQTAWAEHARRVREIAAADRVYVAKEYRATADLAALRRALLASIPIAYGV
jgi:hypothetical protein